MADLPNRLKYEAELQKIVASTLAEHPEWKQGTAAPEAERSLKEKLLALLALIFKIGSATAAAELGIAIQSEGAARRWSDTYSGYLASRVMDGISKRLQKARNRDLTGETSLVQDTIDAIQTEKNWGNFAATEITRANTTGGEFSATIYNIGRINPQALHPQIITNPVITPIGLPPTEQPQPGEQPQPAEQKPPEEPPNIPEVAVAYWHTSQDLRVCPVCKPLDGRPRDEWERYFPLGPPAHGQCRCWIDYEVAE